MDSFPTACPSSGPLQSQSTQLVSFSRFLFSPPPRAQVEKERGQLKELCERQAEQLSRASLQLQEKTSENEAEIRNLKETIFELEDQVEQHRALKLHDNQTISDLESRWKCGGRERGEEDRTAS